MLKDKITNIILDMEAYDAEDGHAPAMQATTAILQAIREATPKSKIWNQAEGRDGKCRTDGWNACLDEVNKILGG